MEFHSPFGLKYGDFRKGRFLKGLKKPQQIFVSNDYSSKKRTLCKISELLTKSYDSYHVKYFICVKEASLYERISLGSYTFELYTNVNDEEKKKITEEIFSLYGVKRSGFIPKEFSGHNQADHFLFRLLDEEDKKRKNLLGFENGKRKIFLKKNPDISLRLRLEKGGFYYLCDNRETYKKEREALAENIHQFIQKQKVRMIVGVK